MPPFPQRANLRLSVGQGQFTSPRSGPRSTSHKPWPALLPAAKLHYNPFVRSLSRSFIYAYLALSLLCLSAAICTAQQVPPASGARILLMPRKLVTGEHATLAVLDVAGRLTPNVKVAFSNGDNVTTDTTGRALFVAPLSPGNISATIEGRTGRVTSTILSPADVPSADQAVTAAPRVASVSDRFEFYGNGFCGDADANHVTIAGLPGLVLAASPGSLTVLPPAETDPGPAVVKVSCGQKSADPFTIVFVSLELEARSTPLPPGEHRTLTVRVHGSTTKINLEAHNLAPDTTELIGGGSVKAISSGGVDNVAKFELVGKKHGNFTVSIRLLAPLSPPKS
jgi:hypothetical protein